jgi:hypothetical protein
LMENLGFSFFFSNIDKFSKISGFCNDFWILYIFPLFCKSVLSPLKIVSG